MNTIPAIDISGFYTGNLAARQALGDQVAEACRTIGFLVISGHGVDRKLIDDVRAVSLEFFDLPMEEKQRYRPPPGVLLRGYTPPETNTLSRSRGIETPPDFREMISIGRPEVDGSEYAAYPDARPFYNPNFLPAEPAQLLPLFTAYFREMERLSRDIMRLFALGLGLDESFFDDKIDNHFAAFHALHYAAQPQAPLPGQLRAGAHSDFGSLTVLMPPATGGEGLEVLSPDGGWIPVNPEPGSYVINIGDLMQQWTNDRWVSTTHRVVNPPGSSGWKERRLSLGFFCHPNFDAPLEALPTCLAPGEMPKYAPTIAGEYMRRRISAVRHIDVPEKAGATS